MSDTVYMGSYSADITSSVTASGSVTIPNPSTLVGETMSLGYAGSSDSRVQDAMLITSLAFTNTTMNRFRLTLSFTSGTLLCSASIIPPNSTVHIVTADSPLYWPSTASTSQLVVSTSGPGHISSIADSTLGVTMTYTAIKRG